MTGLRASAREVIMPDGWRFSQERPGIGNGERKTKSRGAKEHQEGGGKSAEETHDRALAQVDADRARKAGRQNGETRAARVSWTKANRKREAPVIEAEATYEIVKKSTDNSTSLVEAVKGLEMAEKRVTELNAEGPDQYFVFDPAKASVVEPSEPGVAIDPFAP
jgi:hypothetical protein